MAQKRDENFIKVVFIDGENNQCFYVNNIYNFTSFGNYFADLLLDKRYADLKMYWIDESGDKIQIIDEQAWRVFQDISNSKKVYLEDKTKIQGNSGQSSTKYNGSKAIHGRVSCDMCGMYPIVGHRYKCVQCPDFDLCMQCEGKFAHPDHVMFRFPKRPEEIPFNKRFLKRMRKGSFIGADGEQDEYHGHGRRNRHHNVFGRLYTMMHDMAEGTEGPEETSGSDDKEDDNIPTKEKLKEKKRWNRNHRSHCGNIPPIDPTYIKSGVQILNNFSQMFAKMLDPIVIDVEIGESGNNTNEKRSEKENNDSKKKAEEEKVAGPEKKNDEESKIASETEKLTISNSEPGTSKQIEKSVNLPEEENDVEMNGFTIILPDTPDNQGQSSNASASASVDNTRSPSISRQASSSASISKGEQPQPKLLDYATLSNALKTHIEAELQQNKAANEPTVTPPTRQPVETRSPEPRPEMRAQIVYHPLQHINNAIIAMMSMGFSNEGGCLTRLLEQVNGDICQALEFLKPVK